MALSPQLGPLAPGFTRGLLIIGAFSKSALLKLEISASEDGSDREVKDPRQVSSGLSAGILKAM